MNQDLPCVFQSALGAKSFMKDDYATHRVSSELQSEETLMWNTIENQVGDISEAELCVIIGIAHKHTTF